VFSLLKAFSNLTLCFSGRTTESMSLNSNTETCKSLAKDFISASLFGFDIISDSGLSPKALTIPLLISVILYIGKPCANFTTAPS
jgi:hypothetical protein